MAYTLTLTRNERKAIDFVGGRYAHGDELSAILFEAGLEMDEYLDWQNPEDITYNIPEHLAWQILEVAEAEEYRWDLFGPELAQKMNEFCERIV